jgi:hypothetical protein
MEDSRILDSICRIVPSLWKTLAKIRPFSSMLENMVTLFCQIIKSSPEVSLKMVAGNASIMEGVVNVYQQLCVLLILSFSPWKSLLCTLSDQLPGNFLELSESKASASVPKICSSAFARL